ncbi:MAG: hypothetical protein JJE21_00510 [Spirochaetaceae bacterium]|nr:hypothetical protein [Spirochaetaceae bacterium]
MLEANTFLSKIGFESDELFGAHAIHNGFTAIKETLSMCNYEKVISVTITQLLLDNVYKE